MSDLKWGAVYRILEDRDSKKHPNRVSKKQRAFLETLMHTEFDELADQLLYGSK